MSMTVPIADFIAHNRKASNALCTLVKREKKSFQVPAKTASGTWRISQVTSCRPPGRPQKRPDDRTWNAGVAVRTADGSRRTADAVTIREIAASACRTPISAGAEGDSRHFRTYAFDSSFTRPQRWTWVQFARPSSTQPTFLTTQPNPSKQNRCSATLSNSIMPTTERKCAENYNKWHKNFI